MTINGAMNNIRHRVMRNLLLAATVVALLLTGCRKEDNYNYVSLDKHTVEMRTGDTRKIHVISGDPDNVVWQSANEFVASVTDGEISGLRIGQTQVVCNNAAVSVTVKGRIDLYDEPMDNLRWGMTKEQLVTLLGVPGKIADNILTYNVVSSVNSFKSYEFDRNNRLITASITVAKDKTSQLDDFLAERYMLINSGDSHSRDYINSLKYSTASMVVSRTSYDENYWLVSYQQVN